MIIYEIIGGLVILSLILIGLNTVRRFIERQNAGAAECHPLADPDPELETPTGQPDQSNPNPNA